MINSNRYDIKNKHESVVKEVNTFNPLYYSQKEKLKLHKVSQNEEHPFICYLCERGFKEKRTLMNHENAHLWLKPYQCQSCKSNFNSNGELDRHTKYIHTRVKSQHCTECDYRCIEKEKLRRHMRIHTGERPYQCTDCSYAAADMFKIKRHRRTHTGEKPYKCDICMMRFTQSNSLKEHRLKHQGYNPRFQCEICPVSV